MDQQTDRAIHEVTQLLWLKTEKHSTFKCDALLFMDSSTASKQTDTERAPDGSSVHVSLPVDSRQSRFKQHLIHLETQKDRLPPSHSFLCNGTDPRPARLITAQRSHPASLSRNRTHRQPGPLFSVLTLYKITPATDHSASPHVPRYIKVKVSLQFFFTGVKSVYRL